MAQHEFNWPVSTSVVNSGPLQFDVNGVAVTVNKDTVTPANSIPLPVEILSGGTPLDTSTLAQQTTLSALNNKIILGQTSMANSLPVVIANDQTGVTFPVSAVALPLPNGAATSANQTNGSQKTQIVDGSGNVIASTNNSLNVNLLNGFLSTANSSTTPLGIGASFTGTSADITNYSSVNILVTTDRSGIMNMQFSSNGTNWDHDDAYACTVTTGGVTQSFYFQGAPIAKYFRVKYDNDGTAQGVFRLQTVFKVNAGVADVQDLSTEPVNASNGMVTKSVIYGLTTGGGGGYKAVKVNPSGALTTDVSGTVAATQATSPWVVSDTTQGSVTGGTAGTTSALGGGIYNSSTPSLTNGQQASLQLEATGSLRSSITGVSLTPTATFAAATVTKSGLAISSLDNSLVCALHPSYALPTGANTIGSIASINNALPTGSNTIGGVNQSGTWNIGTLSTISNALPAGTNTLGNIKITDGTNTAAVKGASTAAVATDPALVVAISPNNPLTFSPSPNSAGSYAEITNLTTTAQTFTKPTNAVGFILETLSDNTVNVRYKIGATATTTSGMRMEPGRDTGYVPCAANISVIAESGTNQVVTVQWVLSA